MESGLECVLTGALDGSGAHVAVYDDQRDHQATVSSEGDTLRISNLRPGHVYLRISPRSATSIWLPQYFDRRDSLAVADPVMIPPDGQIAHGALTLVAGGRIRGRILDAMGRPPATERLRMRIHAADDSLNSIRNYSFYNCCYDEVTGDYVINQLPDGVYKLRASDKVLWTWWPHHASFAAGGTVNIENHGEVEGVDWQLIY